MSLRIVIGFNGPIASAKPELVYLGRSGSEALAAREASLCERFFVLDNPMGYPKNNPRCQANRAAQDPQAILARARAEQLQKISAEEAEKIQQRARAEAEAMVASGEIARVALETVAGAIATLIMETTRRAQVAESQAAEIAPPTASESSPSASADQAQSSSDTLALPADGEGSAAAVSADVPAEAGEPSADAGLAPDDDTAGHFGGGPRRKRSRS
jgi:hypothetical protein